MYRGKKIEWHASHNLFNPIGLLAVGSAGVNTRQNKR
jgi:hypothetical protein